MKRYLLHMSYIGDHFRGMQRQPFLPTIQGTVETALQRFIQPPSLTPPKLHISSRTDCGVHALSTTSHVDLTHPIDGRVYDMARIKQYLNRTFGKNGLELRITSCTEVSPDFHARHSAISRSYLYRLMIPKEVGQRSFPIHELNRCYIIRSTPFDVERVKEGTKLFLGWKDFRTFASSERPGGYSTGKINYKRELNYFNLEKGRPLMIDDPLSNEFDFWDIRCGAKAFLHNQVRRMVGALVALGIGRVTEKDIRRMLEIPSKNSWDTRVVPAPAQGLYLCQVNYDPLHLKMNTINEE